MTITILMILAGIIIYIILGLKYKEGEFWTMAGLLLILIWIPLSFTPVYLIGFHYETGRGEHFGYVTAVQKQGIFFKTGRAYIKTDNQSSQEDSYCVIDDDVYRELQNFAKFKERVTVKYFSWFSNGIKNCQNEGDIIYELSKITE